MNKTKRVIRNEQKNTKTVSSRPVDPDKKLKIFAGIGIVAFFLLVAIVCYETFHKDPVLRVGDQKYYLSDIEVLYNVYESEVNVENTSQAYAQYLGYDADAYWNSQGVKDTAKSTAMTAAISNLVLAKEAEEKGIVLTEEEKQEVEATVDKAMDKMTKKRLSKTGFTKEKVLPYLLSVKLGEKYKDQLIESYNVKDTDVTVDQTQYDEREVEAISALLVEYDSEGNKQAISDDKKAEIKAQMEAYLAKAKAGEDFSKLVPENDETYVYGTQTFLVGEDEVDSRIEEAATKLNNGDVSDMVETDNAMIIMKMKDTASTKAYDEAVQKAIQAKQQELWQVELAGLKLKYDVQILSKGWDKVELGSVTLKPGDELSELAVDPTASPDASADPSASPEAK